MAEEEFSMTEQLSFMDMLQPWPHHLHVITAGEEIFAACDCGWVGQYDTSARSAVMSYRDHIEQPG